MCLLFVPHTVVFPAEAMTAKGTLKLAVARVNHVMSFQVLAGGESLVTLTTLKPFLVKTFDLLRLAAAVSIR